MNHIVPVACGSAGIRPRSTRRTRCEKGFTLIEVLATLLLLAIVLPAVNMALIGASKAGETAKNRTEAASLAQSKLSELIAGYTWNGGGPMSGDFGNDEPGFTWHAAVSGWTDGTQNVSFSQLDVTVEWYSHNSEESITISSLVYIRPVPTS